MSNVLQLINDKLSKAVVARSAPNPATLLPCDVRPIPFEVPTSFRSRERSDELPSRRQRSPGQRDSADPEGARETTVEQAATQRTSLSRSLEFRGKYM